MERTLQWDQVCKFGVCHELRDTEVLGHVGSHQSQRCLGDCWGSLSSGDPRWVLGPSGWSCLPSKPGTASPAPLLGQFETVAGLPDKEPLVMKCLLSSSVAD